MLLGEQQERKKNTVKMERRGGTHCVYLAVPSASLFLQKVRIGFIAETVDNNRDFCHSNADKGLRNLNLNLAWRQKWVCFPGHAIM
jgi:hypothetical protein